MVIGLSFVIMKVFWLVMPVLLSPNEPPSQRHRYMRMNLPPVPLLGASEETPAFEQGKALCAHRNVEVEFVSVRSRQHCVSGDSALRGSEKAKTEWGLVQIVDKKHQTVL